MTTVWRRVTESLSMVDKGIVGHEMVSQFTYQAGQDSIVEEIHVPKTHTIEQRMAADKKFVESMGFVWETFQNV